MMDAHSPTDDDLRAIFLSVRRIAVVGFSHKPTRPSHGVAQYLFELGYQVLPVNPGLAGQTYFGRKVAASLRDLGEPVDMVDVFHRSEYLPEIVADMRAMNTPPGVLWTQLDVVHDGAAQAARAAGMRVVQNRCPRIEIPRLFPPGWMRV